MSPTLTPPKQPQATAVPQIAAFSHIDLTVTDIAASVAWYRNVFGLSHVMHETHPDGFAEVLVEPRSQVFIGLSQHRANRGEAFAEHRTGLDHVSFLVPGRDDLVEWQAHLERLGVRHSPIADVADPFPYSVLVFRDPDNIQLELIAMGAQPGA
jgi:catechol 2,3-dioxygenase-like lactoylglutathione lyase family enzyme